jgi:4-hydroxybenzoate polyprenyltransferase
MQALHKISVTLEKIKWEHSIFALPFVFTDAMLAASGWPRLYQLLGLSFAWS